MQVKCTGVDAGPPALNSPEPMLTRGTVSGSDSLSLVTPRAPNANLSSEAGFEWPGFLNTYRTLCLSPRPKFAKSITTNLRRDLTGPDPSGRGFYANVGARNC